MGSFDRLRDLSTVHSALVGRSVKILSSVREESTYVVDLLVDIKHKHKKELIFPCLEVPHPTVFLGRSSPVNNNHSVFHALSRSSTSCLLGTSSLSRPSILRLLRHGLPSFRSQHETPRLTQRDLVSRGRQSTSSEGPFSIRTYESISLRSHRGLPLSEGSPGITTSS